LGSWQWISKSGGFAGQFIKIDSTPRFILTILPNKIFTWCKNDNCFVGSWSYGNELTNDQKNTITLMKFSENNRANDFPLTGFSFMPFAEGDTISFATYCYDCFAFEFKRIKK
jgi:hypothetical protein